MIEIFVGLAIFVSLVNIILVLTIGILRLKGKL